MSKILMAKLVFILGIVNILALFLVLFSCRCLLGRSFKIFARFKHLQFFLNKYHCYFWIIFIVSVFFHSFLAIILYRSPF